MTPGIRTAARVPRYWLSYALVLALTVAIWTLYGTNFTRWSNSPDFGWRTMYNSGPNVVAQVFELGRLAGLRPGDRILAINGRAYSTFDQLFFGDIRRSEPGSVNTYTILRQDRPVDLQ